MADPKLRAPRQEFGYLAIVVYLALLCILYRDKGYYIEYNDQTREDVIWSVTTEFLTGKYQPNQETIAQVIDRLAACGLFSGDLYQQGYITSKRAQETYYKATLDRKAISVDWHLWLLDEADMNELSARSVILQNWVSRSNNGVNRPINEVSPLDKYTKERKENERKGKQSKAEERKERSGALSVSSVIRETFEQSFGRAPDENFVRTAQGLVTADRPLAWVLDAIRQAGGKKGCDRPEAYTLGVIRLYRPPKQQHQQETELPNGELARWEQDWLEEVKRRKAARAKEEPNEPD